MTKRYVYLCSILAVFVLSGCAEYWYQEDKSFEDCRSDLRQCYRELKKYADMDIIGSYEMDFMKDCMREKGYELVGEGKLPYNVKRQDPETDTFWVQTT